MVVQSCLERPALGNYYSIAGRYFFVESSDEWCASLFERNFAGWYATTVKETPPSIDCSIKVTLVKETPQIPSGLEGFEVSVGGYCHIDGKTHYLEYPDALIVVENGNPPGIQVWLGEKLMCAAATARASIVFNVFGAALRRCGLLELHSGGVEMPDGTGVLIAGPSGSGKSTLTIQLALEGWRYLSDDTLLLSQKEERVIATGLRRVFALTGETIAASGIEKLKTASSSPVPCDHSKRRIDPRELFPVGFVDAVEPAAIFFPVITQEPSSRVVRLSRIDTMSRLLRMCPWACYDRPAAKVHLALLARLAKQCLAFELLSGRDLLGDSNLAARMLTECISEANT